MKKTTTVLTPEASTSAQPLLMAMELSEKSWVLGFTIGLARRRAAAR